MVVYGWIGEVDIGVLLEREIKIIEREVISAFIINL